MIPVNILIYSDYLCPFCFLGKELVKKTQKKFTLNVSWKPYELHPDLSQFMPSLDSGYIKMMWGNVERIAREYEIEIKMPKYLSHSRKALETSEFARKFNKFEECHERIFNSYFLEEKNIEKEETLFEIIEELGLNSDELKVAWNNNSLFEIIKKSIHELHSFGITGVPAFFIGNKKQRIIVGAQPQEFFEKIIMKSLDEDNE